MNHYILKQFLRNKVYILSLVLLFLVGIMSIFTGKKLLDRQKKIVLQSTEYQKESIKNNVAFHKDDLGLIFYYQRFNLVNESWPLSGLNIGVRDMNPNILGVNIRNLEEQRHNTDFYNPANAASGNFDFVFVLIFIFPLIIIAMNYNLQSEEVERGTWKMLKIQSENIRKYLDLKLLYRFVSVIVVYVLLFVIALIWLKIPINSASVLFFFCGLFYLAFWAAISRWVVSLRKSSAFNALLLVGFWVLMNFVIPMTANIFIEKAIPLNNSVEAFMRQRDGYHNKWDEPRAPTMEKFYKIYPQYRKYTVTETEDFSWTWYYAMQQLGDTEAKPAAEKYAAQMQKQQQIVEILGFFLPNIHTLTSTGILAKSDITNQLAFGKALEKFHEDKRLSVYSLIFEKKPSSAVNWDAYKVEYFSQKDDFSSAKILIPHLLFIILLLVLSQINYKKL